MALDHGLDEDEENDVYRMIHDSGHVCTKCAEEIMLVEEIFMLWIVAGRMNGEFQIQHVQSDDGDFLFPPQFFCFTCWEEAIEELEEYIGGTPQADERSIFECAACDSGVRVDEYFGQIVIGEIRCSQKMPNGEVSNYFHGIGSDNPPILCISCIKVLNDDVVVMWEEGVDQDGECDEGTHLRCWREGCSTSCRLNEE